MRSQECATDDGHKLRLRYLIVLYSDACRQLLPEVEIEVWRADDAELGELGEHGKGTEGGCVAACTLVQLKVLEKRKEGVDVE